MWLATGHVGVLMLGGGIEVFMRTRIEGIDMHRRVLNVLLAVMGITAAAYAQPEFNDDDFTFVRMETSKGSFMLALDKRYAPITVANFVEYVEAGHYAGTVFHRVMPNFMIQGGGFDTNMTQKRTNDPIENEWTNGLSNRPGTIAMARTGDPNSATSQFFINVVDNARTLDSVRGGPGYAVFGGVIEGMDAVEEIRNVETGPSQFNPRETSSPVDPPVITNAELIASDDLSESALEGLEKYITDAESWREARETALAAIREAEAAQAEKNAVSRAAFEKAVEALNAATPQENGLVIADGVVGTGESPESIESQVRTHYRGWLIDGTQFDASYDNPSGQPLAFALNRVIAGWGEGLQTMKEGGTRYLRIPPEMAYGANSRPPIPPNSTLIFEVTLLDAYSAAELKAPYEQALAVLDERGEEIGEGLEIATLVEGIDNATAEQTCAPESTVTMHFTIWQDNGTEVFDSRRNNAPAEGLERAVSGLQFPGIERGMVGMVPGEIRVMRMPSELGVPADRRGQIPEDAGFVVRMESIEISTPIIAPDSAPASNP